MADAVLIDLVARRAPGTDVVFLDTGYHFEETLTMRDAVAATYRGRINLDHRDARADGRRAGRRARAATCSTATRTAAASCARCCRWTARWPATTPGRSGLRRDDSIARSRTQVVDWDRRNGMVKVNPLARWTQADVDAYVERHDILINPLLADGYASIGCFPCTRRTGAGRTPAAAAGPAPARTSAASTWSAPA